MVGSENHLGNSGLSTDYQSYLTYKNSDFISYFVNDSIGHPDFESLRLGSNENF